MTVFLDENSRRGVDRLTGNIVASTPGDLYTAALASFIKNEQSDSATFAQGAILAEQGQRAKRLGIELPDDLLGLFDPGLRARLMPTARTMTPAVYDDAVRRANEVLRDPATGMPEGDREAFLTVGEIEQRTLDEAIEARERFEEVRARAVPGWRGTLAEFGAIGVGVVTDPINIMAFAAAAPIAFQNLGRAILVEGGVGLISESLVQTKVIPFLMEQGISRGDALAQAAEKVISAGVFGGIFGGVGFGVIRLGRTAFRKFIRGEAEAVDQVIAQLDSKRAQLTPEQRASVDVLKEVREAEKTAPFKTRDPDAMGEHLENLAAAEEAAKAGKPLDLPHDSIVERTEAGAQRVIPGAERISERAAAERGIAAPLRGKRTQIAADEGLFDVAARRQIDIVDEARRLAREAKTEPEDELDKLLDELRSGRVTAKRKPESLTQFLKEQGGLKEFRGELKSIGISAKTRPGLVNNKSGRSFDDAALKAWEEGFFPELNERPTISQFLEVLEEDFRGSRKRFHPGDEALVEKLQTLDALDEELFRLDIDFKAMSNAEVRQRLAAAARAVPAIEELAGIEGDPLKAANAFREMADDIPARIRELEDLMAQADEIGIGGREAIEVDLDTLEIPLPDGRIVTAREFFELQKEKDRIVEAFLACVGVVL